MTERRNVLSYLEPSLIFSKVLLKLYFSGGYVCFTWFTGTITVKALGYYWRRREQDRREWTVVAPSRWVERWRRINQCSSQTRRDITPSRVRSINQTIASFAVLCSANDVFLLVQKMVERQYSTENRFFEACALQRLIVVFSLVIFYPNLFFAIYLVGGGEREKTRIQVGDQAY